MVVEDIRHMFDYSNEDRTDLHAQKRWSEFVDGIIEEAICPSFDLSNRTLIRTREGAPSKNTMGG
jgi:hypothetical protein